MASTRKSIQQLINQAWHDINERNYDKAMPLIQEILDDSNACSDDKVMALQAKGKALAETEKFDESWDSYEEALNEANNIGKESRRSHAKEFLLTYKATAPAHALLLLDDPAQMAKHKLRLEKSLKLLQGMQPPPSLQFKSRHKYYQDILSLIDSKESKEPGKNDSPVSSEIYFLLHFLLQGRKDSVELAIKSFEKSLQYSGEDILLDLKIYRKYLFPIMLRSCFFNKKVSLDKDGLDVLKNWILQQLPSLNPDLRIRVMIHALCGVTLLGQVYHTGTGGLGLTPSLGRKGRLRDVAESLSKEAKIEVDRETRELLDRDVKLKNDLIKYFPELSRKLYPDLAKMHSAQQNAKKSLPVKLDDVSPSINKTDEGNRYITNASL